ALAVICREVALTDDVTAPVLVWHSKDDAGCALRVMRLDRLPDFRCLVGVGCGGVEGCARSADMPGLIDRGDFVSVGVNPLFAIARPFYQPSHRLRLTLASAHSLPSLHP